MFGHLLYFLTIVFGIGVGTYGFYYLRSSSDSVGGCCVLLLSLVLILVPLWLLWKERREKELKNHAHNLLKEYENHIESRARSIRDCIWGMLQKFEGNEEFRGGRLLELIDKVCSEEREVLKALLQEKSEILERYLDGDSSGMC